MFATPEAQELLQIANSKDLLDAVDEAVASGATFRLEKAYGGSRRMILKDDSRPTAPWAIIRISTRTRMVCGGEVSVVGNRPGEVLSVPVADTDSAVQALRSWFAPR